MSDPHLSPPMQRIHQPNLKSTETPRPPDEESYNCICGTPERSENWICCDNTYFCPIKWYHWQCVRITAPPSSGEWFCPTCRPPIPTNRPKMAPRIPTKPPKGKKEKSLMWVGAVSEDEDKDRDEEATPTKPAKKAPRMLAESVIKKGIAIKKATPKKKKGKWPGWFVLASEDEDKDEDEEATAVRAKTRETMIRVTRSGNCGRRSVRRGDRSALKRVQYREHGMREKRTMSRGRAFEEEDGTKTVTPEASAKHTRAASLY